MTTPRICINCKHCTVSITDRREIYTCSATRHLVDGRVIKLECATNRSAKYGKCGPTGKQFEVAPAELIVTVTASIPKAVPVDTSIAASLRRRRSERRIRRIKEAAE